jgi:hypothetical protein
VSLETSIEAKLESDILFYEWNFEYIVEQATKLVSLKRAHPDECYDGDLSGSPESVKGRDLDQQIKRTEERLEGALENQNEMESHLEDALTEGSQPRNEFEATSHKMTNLYHEHLDELVEADVYETKVPEEKGLKEL